MARELFTADELEAIVDATVDVGLGRRDKRDGLLARLPERVRLNLSDRKAPLAQLRSDLEELNPLSRTSDHPDPPLALWLDAAAVILRSGARTEADRFERWAQQARSRARGASHDGPLQAWRDHVRSLHGALQPFFQSASLSALSTDDVVQIEVRADARSPGLNARADTLTLRALLDRPRSTRQPTRWVILGEPGAGKSTMARSLVWRLAGEGSTSPIPIILSLTRAVRDGRHPFEIAEGDLRQALGPPAEGLARALFECARAAEAAPVWLLLDGFDEVPPEQVGRAIELLRAWSRTMPWVAMAVLSRPIGWPHGELDVEFARADIRPLRVDQQQRLLESWMGTTDGRETWRQVSGRPTLRDLGRNPLMLTLLAMLSRSDEPLPDSRSTLYDHAIRLLLERGHGPVPTKGVRSPELVRWLLGWMSFDLTEEGGEAWSRSDLVEVLAAPLIHDDALARRCRLNWHDLPGDLLTEIATETGIIGPHDGPTERWRFLHRSIKERLAAEFMAQAQGEVVVARLRASHDDDRWRRQQPSWRRPPDDAEYRGWPDLPTTFRQHLADDSPAPQRSTLVLERIRAIAEDGRRPAQWGETLGMACGLLDDSAGAIEQIRVFSRPLALRALADTETLSAEETLRLVETTRNDGPDWKGDLLWDGTTIARLMYGRAGASAALWRRVTPERDVQRLAWLYHALDALEGPIDRVRFFTACGRWPAGGVPEPELVAIEPGAFYMGSPDDEDGRHENEGPRAHTAIDRRFAIAPTPVTVAQYRRFDPTHRCRGEGDSPVTEVSWWTARLYAAWLDCALPPEAAWEYACRAGTTTAYASGSTAADLGAMGWYNRNARLPRPVGQRRPNPWGLSDMHGNVWEWCADAYAPSLGGHDDRSAPTRPLRVLRGGSYADPATDCRSARRRADGPGMRHRVYGFRLWRG